MQIACSLIAAVMLWGATTAVTSLVAGPGEQLTTPASPPAMKKWTVEELLPAVADLGTGHDWGQGRELFKKGACGGCHAFGAESQGSGLAPDLTGVGSKYTRDFILQSILEPSATLNGQYYHTTFTLKNGDVITGSVIDVVDKTVIVAPSMLAPQVTVRIPQGEVKSEAPSPISPMPAGLLDGFTKAQVIELLAFLDAGGDRNAAVYTKK